MAAKKTTKKSGISLIRILEILAVVGTAAAYLLKLKKRKN